MIRTARSGWIWDPLQEMRRLEQELGSVFPGVNRSRAATFPPINVFVGDDDVVIASEIPGIDPQDVDLSVTGDTLTIKGNRKPHELKEGQTWHRRERGTGSFFRTVQLPYNVDGSKVEADYNKGVLKIMLPRLEAEKPKKIEIKAS